MSKKFDWKISLPGYGEQFNVVANTCADAIAIADAMWLDLHSWQNEAHLEIEGFVKSPIPDYSAKRIK